ncbi:MAG TPA: glycine cleavage T C-terminal barrel domain-containing protein [Rhizomicrobium sp.]|nr:glycine cleavage T C-terminal barrel domain-containing protein [Rhizomicrobium sp.]
MTLGVMATPFHMRGAAFNRGNAWATRNGWTLSRVYSSVEDEALAARSAVVLSDITWRWRVTIEGAQAANFLSRLATKNLAELSPGMAAKALWLTDGGAVRGAGLFARFGREAFALAASAPDTDWIAQSAALFGVTVRDISPEQGGLAIIGPYAAHVLRAAGLACDLAPLAFRKLFWRGLDITLSRWGEHEGYEIWCAADDGLLVWDRLMKAGGGYGIVPAGLDAMDVLDIEAGILRPGRDYKAASDTHACAPTPMSLGLETLIDAERGGFNGRAAWAATRKNETHILAGIEIESETPAAHTPLQCAGAVVGHTLTSVFSPALRRAIALARIEKSAAAVGTQLSLTLAPCAQRPEFRTVHAYVAEMPFLPTPQMAI